MAKQTTKIEIVKDGESAYPDFFEILKPHGTKPPKKDRKSKRTIHQMSTISLKNSIIQDIKHLRPNFQRVFLYLKLENITNLPPSDDHLKLLLKHHKNSINKLDTSYKDTHIDLSSFENYKPTFSVTIDQDSIEDLNCFADNPLHITLYETSQTRRTSNASENDQTASRESTEKKSRILSEGYIDLLQFFCGKRTGANVLTYLYPVEYSSIFSLLETTRATWQVYTLLPLLKNTSFCNVAYIGFESIYNAKPELVDDYKNLTAHLWFRSKIPNERNEYAKEFLCSFSGFDKVIISEQNINQKWETIKNNSNENALGIYTGCHINIYRLFKNLLCSDGIDFQLNDIDVATETALVANSAHRYILNEQMSRVLEDCVAFNEQEILIEIVNVLTPDEILLQGVIDLSIFLYPSINAIRFAVDLLPPQPVKPVAVTPKASATSAKSNKSKNKGSSAKSEAKAMPEIPPTPPRRTFAILSICLVSPITDPIAQLSVINENPMMQDRLKTFIQAKSTTILRSIKEISEEEYQQFDDLVSLLIDYIVKNQIKSTTDAKNFFCCHMRNIINKVMRLISYDFNIRFPTTTNAQFANLMTTVYKELAQRIYDRVQNCNLDVNDAKRKDNNKATEKLFNIISTIKVMYEVGNDEMGDFLLAKIKKEYANDNFLNFSLYIYDVEKHRFESAQEYQRRPLKERIMNCDYFMHIIRIYIKYMNDLDNEETALDAFENLLDSLRYLILLYPKELEGFILLYCLYKKCGYLPGVNYARWKFENLYNDTHIQIIPLPLSLWQIYNNFNLEFKSTRNQNIYNVMKLFLTMGLYKFAEFLYAEISIENTEVEKYLVTSTLKVLLNEVDKKYAMRTFPAEKLLRAQEIKAFNAQINGNLEYYRGNIDGALKNYSRLLDINDLENKHYYRLSFMRYGFTMIAKEQYEKAIRAFENCCVDDISCLVPHYEMGKAYYRLLRLEDALKYFAKATKYALHVPDIWGYLALVNLRLGENFKALECWKYAKLKPENIISEEVLGELAKIDYRDIFLYVDLPM